MQTAARLLANGSRSLVPFREVWLRTDALLERAVQMGLAEEAERLRAKKAAADGDVRK